jgi:hypothetical protein
MDKAGWQVTAGIAGIIAVAALFAAIANGRAAAQAYEDLKVARAEKKETVTVHEFHQAECIPTRPDPAASKPWPPGASCKGGVLLKKTPTGWESIVSNGRPIACRD